jgi:hypothetical protein
MTQHETAFLLSFEFEMNGRELDIGLYQTHNYMAKPSSLRCFSSILFRDGTFKISYGGRTSACESEAAISSAPFSFFWRPHLLNYKDLFFFRLVCSI